MNDELNRYARMQRTAAICLWCGIPATFIGVWLIFSSWIAPVAFAPEVTAHTPYSEAQHGSPGLEAAIAEVSSWKYTKALGALLVITGGLAWWAGARMDRAGNNTR